ncbi:MAG: hypothetical protein QOF15_356, partial [Mycobacterium sp.]|nr:hypothetical protein [Mycobacterium sp.]
MVSDDNKGNYDTDNDSAEDQ